MPPSTARVTERELPLANTIRQLDASDGDHRSAERLQTMHRA